MAPVKFTRRLRCRPYTRSRDVVVARGQRDQLHNITTSSSHPHPMSDPQSIPMSDPLPPGDSDTNHRFKISQTFYVMSMPAIVSRPPTMTSPKPQPITSLPHPQHQRQGTFITLVIKPSTLVPRETQSTNTTSTPTGTRTGTSSGSSIIFSHKNRPITTQSSSVIARERDEVTSRRQDPSTEKSSEI